MLIPYLIWNLIAYLYLFAITNLPFLSNKIQTSKMNFNFIDLLMATLNADYSVLWYVKYLMFFVLITPITYLLNKNKKIGVIFIILLVMVNGFFITNNVFPLPMNVNDNNIFNVLYNLTFYFIGSFAALHLKFVVENSKKNTTLIGIVVFFMGLLFIPYIYNLNDFFIGYCFRINMCIFLWFALNFKNFNVEPKWWMKLSFFLYCFHNIILQILQRIILLLSKKTNILPAIVAILDYFITPLICVLIVVCTAYLLKKYFNRLWLIISGGRG